MAAFVPRIELACPRSSWIHGSSTALDAICVSRRSTKISPTRCRDTISMRRMSRDAVQYPLTRLSSYTSYARRPSGIGSGLAMPTMYPRWWFHFTTAADSTYTTRAALPQLLQNKSSNRAYSSKIAELPNEGKVSSGDEVNTGAPSMAGRPEPPDYLNEKERDIFDRLMAALDPVALQVEDISGGCGSMYAVAITSAKFKGLPVIRQHRIVNEVLGDDIKKWHGIQLRTKAP